MFSFWGPDPLTGDCVCEPRWGHVILSARVLKSATSERGLEVVVSGVEHFILQLFQLLARRFRNVDTR